MNVVQKVDVIQVKKEENKSITVAAAAVDWLQLPEHLTFFILSKLSCIDNYARFGDVCLQWRSIFNEAKSSLPPQLPLLVIPTPPEMMIKKKKKKKNKNKKKKNDTSSTVSCSFYRVTDGKIFNRGLQLTLPCERQFCGSGFGWLVTVDQDEMCYSVQLVNPFLYPNTATKEIKLPPLTAHPTEINNPAYLNYALFRNVVLSADPASNLKDCVVMAIFGGLNRLSFCRPGDKGWTPLIEDGSLVGFYDLIYYQGNFYALDYKGAVLICDVEKRTITTFAEPPVRSIISSRKYLVVSEGGELFQIHRYHNDDNNSTRFLVLKFRKRSETNTNWVVAKDLNNRVFFIGEGPSMSISPSDFPGCKPNCIYYTDDNVVRHCSNYDDEREDGPRDLGVFNVGNGSFEKHYVSDVSLWPAPIWIQPILVPSRSKKNLIAKKPIGVA